LNFVPVASDMSDLVERVQWLMTHEDHAICIGNAGRELALSLDYDDQVKDAAHRIGEYMHSDAGIKPSLA
jgi:hypothetical protein